MYITQSAEILFEKLFRKIDKTADDTSYDGKHEVASLIGLTVGSMMSLRGTTEDEESLNAVYKAGQTFLDELNEIYVFDTNVAINEFKYAVSRRWKHFYQGLTPSFSSGESDSSIHVRFLSITQFNEIMDEFRRLISACGLTILTHGAEEAVTGTSRQVENNRAERGE